MTTILLVLSEDEQRLQIREFIEEECRTHEDQAIDTVAVRHVAAAAARLAAQDYPLLVCALHIPEDGSTPRNTENALGLEVARRRSESGQETILVLPAEDPEILVKIDRIKHCKSIDFSQNWAARLEAQIHASLQGNGNGAAPVNGAADDVEEASTLGYFKIIIDQTKRRVLYEAWTDNPNSLDEVGEECDCRPQDLQEIFEDAGLIAEFLESWSFEPKQVEVWWKSFRRMGEKAARLIRLAKLDAPLRALAEEVGGLERVRLIFETDRRSQSIPLEAVEIWDETDFYVGDRRHLALNLPVFRTVKTSNLKDGTKPRLPLFATRAIEDRRINCLVIDATAEGVARLPDGTSEDLSSMAEGTRECDDVIAKLTDLQEKVPILGRVERVPKESGEVLSRDQLFEALECRGDWQGKGPWELVHFCGHSGLHPKEGDDRAYIYVPGSENPGYDAEGIDILRFARLLPHVRFLYLSSCCSADRGFVYELARKQIPAVLGFRWPLNDNTAAAFADSFYDNLFASDEAQDLVSAFKISQERTHETHNQDNTWASAMLMVANMSKLLCQHHKRTARA